jgi:diadenosine tetraphosphate (Ap4A) HIT family hydrolase
MTSVVQGVESARSGTNPGLICRIPSGWAVLCDMQYLSGYTILLPDPVVASINELDRDSRATFLRDMVTIGDALLDVTGAFRINYALMSNSDPFLHAHIVPRYLSEPEEIRCSSPWSYPQEVMAANLLDPQRDRELITCLAEAITKRWQDVPETG